MYSYGTPHMARQKQDDQLEHTFSSYVRIRDVALKTSQRRWTIGRSGERGLGISVLAARHDDDDFSTVGTILKPFLKALKLVSFCCILPLNLDKQRTTLIYKNIILYFYSSMVIFVWNRRAVRESLRTQRSCQECEHSTGTELQSNF